MGRTRRFVQKLLPFAVSAGLIAWLLYSVSLEDLLEAARHLDWPKLVPLTAGMVIALYLWDSQCLRTVYARRDHAVDYGKALRVRGLSYLAGAFNYELGQALIAWKMAGIQKTTVLAALSRAVLLAWHDLIVLLSLGLIGSLLSDDPRTEGTLIFCLFGLLLLVGILTAFGLLPSAVRQRIRASRWGAWFGTWTVRQSLILAVQRCVYFGILLVYAALALWICRIAVDPAVVLGTIPLVLLADALPSLAGLGTRETALMLLLEPDEPATLLAMSLYWSTGMIAVRLLIGLASYWQAGAGNLPSGPEPE